MNKSDITRDYFMLEGPLKEQGYDWWWHSFTGKNERTGEEKSFFIEFFTCNPKEQQEAPVLGQLPLHKENKITPSYVMVKAGWWGKDATQLHRFFPWKAVRLRNEPSFQIMMEDCFLSETMTMGKVKVSKTEVKEHPEYLCDSGEMEWNLTIDKQIAFHVGYGASKPFRKLNAFEMYWHAEGMKTQYEGQVRVNGENYVVTKEDSFGYADKNWGSDFTSPWVWLSSNDLYSKKYKCRLHNSVFDIGGGRPKAFGIPLNRKLLGAFYYEGTNYEFNFSKIWTLARTKFDCEETKDKLIWRVCQDTKTARLQMEIHCNKEEMLLVNYEAPNGKKLHNRLWNGGTGYGVLKLYEKRPDGIALVDEVLAKHVGCEYGVYEQ
ncbi:MAG: tocopherol cyclase family protein [bacterium]|nr:tocopherol cyclase family protein [bacterium]